MQESASGAQHAPMSRGPDATMFLAMPAPPPADSTPMPPFQLYAAELYAACAAATHAGADAALRQIRDSQNARRRPRATPADVR